MAKFQELLNAKKLKIRDQQRLLAGAKVDPAAGSSSPAALVWTKANGETAAAVDHARGTTRRNQPRKAAPSRANKRKANEKTPVVDSESDVGEGSRMQIDDDDAGAKQEEEEFAEAATPEKSDLDETEDEDDEGFDAVPASRPTKTGVGAKGKAVETATQSQSPQSEKTSESLPPRRELPFTKKQSKQQSPKKPVEKPQATVPQVGEDDETTDDDEL